MRAVFLDRDGVINKYPGDRQYVTSLRQFRFLPKVKLAIAKLHKAGFWLFIASNQAGVGKGIFSRKMLDAITGKMLKEIESSGGKIDNVYYCIHPEEDNCSCRKPKAGMIDFARKSFSINLKKSFFVGDTLRDVLTAKAAGCKAILVLSGKEKSTNYKGWEVQPDFVFSNLYTAATFIIKQK